MQQGEIDLIGTVRIGRMNLWLDIGGVVKQDIEHVVAFVLICADDVGIDGEYGWQRAYRRQFPFLALSILANDGH